jgi:hypothetical protein
MMTAPKTDPQAQRLRQEAARNAQPLREMSRVLQRLREWWEQHDLQGQGPRQSMPTMQSNGIP